MCPPYNLPSTQQIGDSTKNGIATLLNTNQIKNDVINKHEKQRNIVAATISINDQKITPKHTA